MHLLAHGRLSSTLYRSCQTVELAERIVTLIRLYNEICGTRRSYAEDDGKICFYLDDVFGVRSSRSANTGADQLDRGDRRPERHVHRAARGNIQEEWPGCRT